MTAAQGRRWVIRDDVPAQARWCPAVTRPGGTFYYAGRDLEGHWWMGLSDAATFAYRDAQRFVRELRHPRPLTLEREVVERVAA